MIVASPDTPAERLLVFTTANTAVLSEENIAAKPVDPEAVILRTGSKQEKSAITGNVIACAILLTLTVLVAVTE